MGRERIGQILVVDDEESILDVVTAALRLVGYEVESASTGIAALRAARLGRFDLLVLDVMLPDMDGFEVCSRLRKEGHDVPVLFLTARTESSDATEGLTLGADDYVRKPFNLEELMARVGVLLRRHGGGDGSSEVMAFGDVEVDLVIYQARRAGRTLDLTPTEFRMLEALVRNSGRVLTRDQLVEMAWDDPGAVETRTVESVVSRLRRKLDDGGRGVAVERGSRVALVTRRGVGYGLLMQPLDQGHR